MPSFHQQLVPHWGSSMTSPTPVAKRLDTTNCGTIFLEFAFFQLKPSWNQQLEKNKYTESEVSSKLGTVYVQTGKVKEFLKLGVTLFFLQQ